jgi:hypothetical protein
MQRFALCFVALGIFSIPASGPAAAQAMFVTPQQNSAVGSDTTPLASDALNATGNTYLKAYSRQTAPAVAPNATVTPLLISGGANLTGTLTVGTGQAGIRVPTGANAFSIIGGLDGTPGGPGNQVRVLANQGKGLIRANNDIESLTSTSGGFTGFADQFQTSRGVRGILAYGLNALGNRGGAAGLAYDPFYLSAGTIYPYSEEINVDINSSIAGMRAGAEFFALDSNTDPGDNNPDTTDFPGQIDDFNDNNSADTLWTLDFSSNGVTSGPGSITADFEINPSETEINFLPSEPGCTGAANVDACIESAVDATLEADLGGDGFNSGGEDVTLFAGATYTPSGTQGAPVEYGEGVSAGVALVPEPASMGLLLIGLTAVGLVGRGRYLFRG